MKKVVLGLLVSLLLWGCSSTKPNDSDAVNDALIGFTVNAQASRWQEALVFVTPDEVDEITDGNGIMKQEYRVAAKRLKLSTLKQMEWELDRKGRLIGMKDAMDESNEKYKVSDEQKTVGTDLDKKRKERIQQKLEEGKRILSGEKEEVQEPEVELYTNKLTEEEKRKYGSTGELRPPEKLEDETSEAAKSKEMDDEESSETSESAIEDSSSEY
jgi:hypothetical protein